MTNRIVAFAAALSVGVLSVAVPATAAEPVAIGAVLSETPAAAANAASLIRAGVEAAVAVANAEEAGKALPVRLVFADDHGTLPGAADAAAALLKDGKVAALIGGQTSTLAPPQIAAAARAGRPYVNVNGWDAALRISGVADVFSISPDSATVPQALAQSAKALGATRVAIVAPAADRGAEARAEPLRSALLGQIPPIATAFVSLDLTSRQSALAAALKREPPDVLMVLQGGTAGARFLAQIRQAGIAPTQRTLAMDAGGIVDSATFWDDAKDAGRLLLSVALQHPGIPLTERGQAVRRNLPTDMPETRLFHQGADAVFALVDALRRARSADPEALVRALDADAAVGTRGPIRFQAEKGPRYRQRIDVPFALVQQVEEGAPPQRAQLVWVAGQPAETVKVARPSGRPEAPVPQRVPLPPTPPRGHAPAGVPR